MADVAPSPVADAPQGKQQIVKPEKPDEDKYKEDLAKAEKEHTAAQDKLVRLHYLSWIYRTQDCQNSQTEPTGTCIASESCASVALANKQ